MFFLQPSHRRLLNSLNPLILVGAVAVFILIRTTGRPLLGWFLQWDVVLPAVVYFGQRRSLPEGLILTLFCSHLFSLSSAAPIGVFTTLYLSLFVVSRLVSLVLYADTWISIQCLLFVLALLSRFILTGVAASFGHGWHLFAPGNFSFGPLILTSVLGYVMYQTLGLLDLLTFKAAPTTIELGEGGL